MSSLLLSSTTTTSPIPPLDLMSLESSLSLSTTTTTFEGGPNGETIIQSEDLPMKIVMTSTLLSASLDRVVSAVESSSSYFSTLELQSDESNITSPTTKAVGVVAISTPSDVVATTDSVATGVVVTPSLKKKKNLLMEILETFTRRIWRICH